MQSVEPATPPLDVQALLRTPLLQLQKMQQQASMQIESELVQTPFPESGDENYPAFAGGNESIRDLQKSIARQLKQSSNAARRASTPPHKRDIEELLDPNMGFMSDVAQPGGFRRFHVHGNNSQAHPSLLQLLLLPECHAASSAQMFGDSLEQESIPVDAHVSATRHSTSYLATGIMVAKCCFCACFLFVPNGFKLAGMIGGPLYLVVVYMCMIWGMYCLIESRKAKGSGRYQDLALVWGKKGQQFLHLCITLICFGFNCISVAGISANLGMLVPNWSSNARLFFFLPLVALLSLVRHLKFFTGTNLMGLIISAATYVYMFGYAIMQICHRGTKPVMLFDTSDFNSLLWLGQCGYTFEIITSVLPIYEAAADKESVFKIIVAVSATLLMFYIMIGFVVYLAFGDDTRPIALLNLPQGSAAGYVLPGLYSLSAATMMPVNNFVIFLSYEPLFGWPSNVGMRKWMKNLGRFALVLLIFTATWLGGAQLQNLLGLVGGVFGMMLALVAPCLLHLALCKPAGWARILNYFVAVFGVQIMGISLYLSLSTWTA